jgi:hypothetical protein
MKFRTSLRRIAALHRQLAQEYEAMAGDEQQDGGVDEPPRSTTVVKLVDVSRRAQGLSAYQGDCSRWHQHVDESDLADLRVSAIKPLHVAGFARWLSTRRTLRQVVREVRFHDMRHTCASHLLQGTWRRRWRLEEVKDFLGHSSIIVTQRYAHLSDHALHEAAAETAARGPTAPRRGRKGMSFPSVGSVGFEPTTNGLKGHCSAG